MVPRASDAGATAAHECAVTAASRGRNGNATRRREARSVAVAPREDRAMLDIPTRAPGRLAGFVFERVHGGNLVYNQCWEDPAVDGEALRLGPRDRVLVITSAGCNALDYALSGARVLAVDVNPRQNHLIELKRAGIRARGWRAFLELMDRGEWPLARRS